jgi:V8-like Glu-specific endopeptidase
MALAMSVDLIDATVQIEQPIADGRRTVGTGFLLADPTPDGKPRTVLVTADHVFEKMPGDQATIGYRVQDADGAWHYAPEKITIRNHGKPVWTRHTSRDVAAITITAPAAFAKAAIPLNWLAGDDPFRQRGLGPGDVKLALGFPQGLSANSAGFPILRSGHVASYPLGPSSAFPTFLLDFRVFPGNSGGPVYVDGDPARAAVDGTPPAPLIAGMLTQEVEVGDENLGIGIVTQAKFIRETVAELDAPAVSSPSIAASALIPAARATSADTASVGR